jgi:hypothetical protein
MKRVVAQTRVELALTLRRGESVLLSLGIPVMLLVFFSFVDVLPTGTDDPVDFLAPGVLALAVMSTAMVGLGIATGFERQYGVLKRLGSTPLGRPALLAAKTLAIVAVEVLQVAVLAGVALALGWRPSGSVIAFVPAMLLATAGFAGLGMPRPAGCGAKPSSPPPTASTSSSSCWAAWSSPWPSCPAPCGPSPGRSRRPPSPTCSMPRPTPAPCPTGRGWCSWRGPSPPRWRRRPPSGGSSARFGRSGPSWRAGSTKPSAQRESILPTAPISSCTWSSGSAGPP